MDTQLQNYLDKLEAKYDRMKADLKERSADLRIEGGDEFQERLEKTNWLIRFVIFRNNILIVGIFRRSRIIRILSGWFTFGNFRVVNIGH